MTLQDIQTAYDALYLRMARSDVERQLLYTQTYLECLAEQIEPLAAAAEIAENFRARHAEMAAMLRELATTAKKARQRVQERERTDARERYHSAIDEDFAPEGLAAIRAMVERLNGFEQSLHQMVKALGERLLTLPALPVRWDPFCEIKVHVAFKTVPGRECYETEDPLELRIVSDMTEDYFPGAESGYYLGDGENHNIFQYQDGHPLQADHHGYLVHCLLDHADLPLMLLPMIDNVWVEVYPRGDGLAWEPRPDEDRFKLRPARKT